jgi:hypothetical protein
MGLLHFTDFDDGKKRAVDLVWIRQIYENNDGSLTLAYWDSGFDLAKESFDELTARYDAIVRGKPSVEIMGDRSEE